MHGLFVSFHHVIPLFQEAAMSQKPNSPKSIFGIYAESVIEYFERKHVCSGSRLLK